MRTLFACFLSASLLLVLVPGAGASFHYFDDSALFQAALADFDRVVTEDFESQAAGSTIADGGSIGEISFNFSLSVFGNPVDLFIDDFFNTSSGTNYLGIDGSVAGRAIDGGSTDGLIATDRSFFAGDMFTISLARPACAFGLFVLSAPGDISNTDTINQGGVSVPVDNIVTLSTPTGALATSSKTPEFIFPDGDEAFFIGFITSKPDEAFTEVTLTSSSNDLGFFFNVDDLTYGEQTELNKIPVLPSALIFTVGIMLLISCRPRVCRVSA
jgi:hypothetical protein